MRFPATRRALHTTSPQSINPPPGHEHQHPQAQSMPKASRFSHLRDLPGVSSVKHWFLDNLRNYCSTTSLHGFNYITRSGITRTERYFWIGVVAVSIIVSIVLVVVSWVWNRETPTVTVIESSHFPTWNVPFPAVTICSFNKISKTKALALAGIIIRPANVSVPQLLQLFRSIISYSNATDYTAEDIARFDVMLQQNNLTLRQLSDRLSPDCMEMISRCIWKGSSTRCDSLFQPQSSIEGQCCTFNYFGRTTNNFPEKIAYQVPKRPYRVTGCGYNTGISVLLNPMAEDYFASHFSSFGFRLFIHDSYNFPDENAETKVVTATRESFVRINPESTYATNEVQFMDVLLRKCLFAHERQLFPMQRYSFVNCMAQCRMALLLSRCGCTPLTMLTTNNSRPCSLQQVYCTLQNKEIFSRALPNIEVTQSKVQDTKTFPCNCLPDCETNNYPSEITRGRLNVNFSHNSKINFNETFDSNNQILLHVFFSDLMSTRYRMEIFQNWLSALGVYLVFGIIFFVFIKKIFSFILIYHYVASFGGLLGLIMGFSIVTAFEFIYFLTFRPIFNYFNDR